MDVDPCQTGCTCQKTVTKTLTYPYVLHTGVSSSASRPDQPPYEEDGRMLIKKSKWTEPFAFLWSHKSEDAFEVAQYNQNASQCDPFCCICATMSELVKKRKVKQVPTESYVLMPEECFKRDQGSQVVQVYNSGEAPHNGDGGCEGPLPNGDGGCEAPLPKRVKNEQQPPEEDIARDEQEPPEEDLEQDVLEEYIMHGRELMLQSELSFSEAFIVEEYIENFCNENGLPTREDADRFGRTLLQCAGCRVRVHARCYGVCYPPGGDVPWKCSVCIYKPLGFADKGCVLCCLRGGAMKRVANLPTEWVHITCALALKESTLVCCKTRGPISLSLPTDPERMAWDCGVCHHIGNVLDPSKPVPGHRGICVECAMEGCAERFHVTCGISRGSRLMMIDGRLQPVCHNHVAQARFPQALENHAAGAAA